MDQIEAKEDYTELADNESNLCFGCSQRNPSGLHMRFYVNKEFDRVVSWFSVPPQFCGWKSVVHGGIISTMLDEAMGWGALVILGKLVLSRSIAVDFKSPVIADTPIRVEGSVREVISERKGVLEGFIYANDVLCAQATSDVSLFTIDYVRKTGFMDETMLGDLEKLVNFKERGLGGEG